LQLGSSANQPLRDVLAPVSISTALEDRVSVERLDGDLAAKLPW